MLNASDPTVLPPTNGLPTSKAGVASLAAALNAGPPAADPFGALLAMLGQASAAGQELAAPPAAPASATSVSAVLKPAADATMQAALPESNATVPSGPVSPSALPQLFMPLKSAGSLPMLPLATRSAIPAVPAPAASLPAFQPAAVAPAGKAADDPALGPAPELAPADKLTNSETTDETADEPAEPATSLAFVLASAALCQPLVQTAATLPNPGKADGSPIRVKVPQNPQAGQLLNPPETPRVVQSPASELAAGPVLSGVTSAAGLAVQAFQPGPQLEPKTASTESAASPGLAGQLQAGPAARALHQTPSQAPPPSATALILAQAAGANTLQEFSAQSIPVEKVEVDASRPVSTEALITSPPSQETLALTPAAAPVVQPSAAMFEMDTIPAAVPDGAADPMPVAGPEFSGGLKSAIQVQSAALAVSPPAQLASKLPATPARAAVSLNRLHDESGLADNPTARTRVADAGSTGSVAPVVHTAEALADPDAEKDAPEDKERPSDLPSVTGFAAATLAANSRDTEAQPAPAQVSADTVPTLAAQLASRLEARTSRFDLKLTPEGLGQVNVSIEIGPNGQLSAKLDFDRPQAASALHARSGELQDALAKAGFDLSGGGLSFTASGARQIAQGTRQDAASGAPFGWQGFGQGAGSNSQNPGAGGGFAGRPPAAFAAAADLVDQTDRSAAATPRVSTRGVDVRI